jgi:adhesin/invasin
VYFAATALDNLVISHAGGFNQSAPVGSAVPVPPGVLVMGVSSAEPIVGATVTFTVTDGGGSITGATTTTNAQGIATVGSWTLGPVPGPNHLTATVTWPGTWFLTMAATGTP